MKHASVVTFHVFFGKIPPLRGLFTNLRESIKEAKSINQPDAKPGIKKPRPKQEGRFSLFPPLDGRLEPQNPEN